MFPVSSALKAGLDLKVPAAPGSPSAYLLTGLLEHGFHVFQQGHRD